MRFRHTLRVVLLGSLLGAQAQASPVPEDECSPSHPGECLNGVTTSVTNGAGLRVSGAAYGDVARARSGRKAAGEETASVAPRLTGLAAGETPDRDFGLWTSYARSNYESHFRFQGQALGYDADADNVLAGVDTLLAGRFLLGAAFGYQAVESESAFNGGRQDSDGVTIAPYAAWLINDFFSVDAAGGYSPLDYDQRRISPTDGTPTRADFDADRWFIAANLNGLFIAGDWIFGARVGYLHTEEEQDSYTESGSAPSAAAGTLRTIRTRNIALGQVVAGAEAAYHFEVFEPYALVVYRNDVSRDDGEDAGGLPRAFTAVQPSDDDEMEFGFGLRFATRAGVTGSLEYAIVEGRDAFDSDTLLLTVRGSF